MPKRANNLYPKIIEDDNLREAILAVAQSHRWFHNHRPNPRAAWLEETVNDRVHELREIIESGFVQQPPKVSVRWDPNARKDRTICEPELWPDQCVHHALIQVLAPIMTRGMDPYCCGSIPGKGASFERKAIERWMRHDYKGTKYELFCDIRHCYDSMTSEVIVERVRQIIKDHRVIDLIERITKDGVGIGYYTSQWFVNTALQPLDNMIRQSHLCKHYARYIDNLTILGPNKRKLRKLKAMIDEWMKERGLELKGDWQIFRTSARLPDAVGYRYGRTFTHLRSHTLLRLKRAVARYRKRRKRYVSASVAQGVLSRLSMLKHCNSRRVYAKLLQGEKLEQELKRIVRNQMKKERLTWSMYLARRARAKRSGRKEPSTQTWKGFTRSSANTRI